MVRDLLINIDEISEYRVWLKGLLLEEFFECEELNIHLVGIYFRYFYYNMRRKN